MTSEQFEIALLSQKLRIVFSEFQSNLPTNPSQLPKYIQLTKDDPFRITRSLQFYYYSFLLPVLLLKATPPIKVDSEILRELILFVKEALPTILTNSSTIDTLIASLPSDSSPTTPLVSGVDKRMADSLTILQNESEFFVNYAWIFIINLTFKLADPNKQSFQTIMLDNSSFPDLILNSLKLPRPDIRENEVIAITNIVIGFPSMKERFMIANLVGRMFEIVDFVSLPLSESDTLFHLTNFFRCMLNPIGDDEETVFAQFPLIRVLAFDPAKSFIKFIFHDSDKLILDEEDTAALEISLCYIHRYTKNMELRSDEHDADIVSELVKWEIRTMVEMENEGTFTIVFQSLLNRTYE
ncbi:hypothetical protein BLNAU_18102 [Blattamonas nauphoetae]|uniref:Uncharacterized protein n=1 Tax=Blattamonas nauphoetae TaxID=2049346 RepID=A0ABQ9X6K1_9EUKA|nr:hypothetical protein BLNAU_18102 [Blattamonas nauphoetae]